jgi:hypothetical protein
MDTARMLAENPINDRRAASFRTSTQCPRCGAPAYGEPRCRECGHASPGERRWDGATLAAGVALAGFVAALAIAVYNDGFAGLVLAMVLMAWGPGALMYGIALDETEHSRKPTRGQEGYVWLKVVGIMPLWMARLISTVWGSVCAILLVSFLWIGTP